MVTLELTDDDLYVAGYIIDYGDGTLSLERDLSDYAHQPGDDFYTTVDDDDLTNLAYLKYSNSKLWHKIADANSIINPFDKLPDNLILPSDINTNLI